MNYAIKKYRYLNTRDILSRGRAETADVSKYHDQRIEGNFYI